MEKVTKRQSNLELLRILSILLIITFHCVYKGGFEFDSYLTINKFMVKFFWMFGEIGVNLFILISGYFMIKSNFKLKKLLLLIFEVLFYHYITLFIAYKIGYYEIESIRDFILSLFPVILNKYWFITVYLIIYILSPYFNILALNLKREDYKKFLLVLLIIYSVIPTFFGLFFNTTESILYYNRLIWLSIVYFIGGYIRLYGLKYIKNIKNSLITIIIPIFIILSSIIIINKYNKLFKLIGTKEVAYLWHPNTIPIIILSTGIFGLFLNLKIKNNKIINKIASTTLGIYILHDGIFAYYLWDNIFKNYIYINSPYLILRILFTVFVIFSFGVIIDLIRQFIENYTVKKILYSKFFNNFS